MYFIVILPRRLLCHWCLTPPPDWLHLLPVPRRTCRCCQPTSGVFPHLTTCTAYADWTNDPLIRQSIRTVTDSLPDCLVCFTCRVFEHLVYLIAYF